MANTDLLRRTMQHIRAHPETWSQIDYRRGAIGCFAYHAALLAGGELAHPAPTIPRPSGGEPYPNHDAHLRCNGTARGLGFSDADEIHLQEFARRALGLNQAGWRPVLGRQQPGGPGTARPGVHGVVHRAVERELTAAWRCRGEAPTPLGVTMHEFFQFLAFRWDVTRAQQIAADLRVHRMNPEPWFGWLGAIRIDEEYVPRADLDRPVIAVRIREADGNAVIIDGWHRVARAQREGISELSVVLLDEDQEYDVRVFGGTKSR
jgi:hypothetical protein